MNINIYKLTCLTNLHVGSGDINYSVVDNEVIKDEILGSPIIPGSGVKGCLARFCNGKLDDNKNIFGEDGKSAEQNKADEKKAEKTPSVRGNVKFLNAELFARPMRVTSGEGSYAMVMSDALKDRFNMLMRELGVSANKVLENHDCDELITVENEIDLKKSIQLNDDKFTKFNEKTYIMNSKFFNQIDLPVTARNKLNDNGTSENLWYEEYVPHETIFYLPIISEDKDLLEKLDKAINNQVIQFGKNASIGFGLCKLENIMSK